VSESIPKIAESERFSLTEEAPKFWRATIRFGFMERPDIPAVLAQASENGCPVHLTDVVYYVGHEVVMHSDDEKGMPRYLEEIFAAMARNSMRANEVYRLPNDSVVDIGRQIAI
jgi:KUP system potassium uptake protein